MITITEDYCSFEIAKLLKEKGFNGECRAAYTSYGQLFTTQIQQYITNILCSKGYLWDCTAPTFQMVRKWLRDTYNLYLFNEYFGESKTYKWRIIEMNSTHKHSDFKHYNTEEEATEASFKYALENLI